MKISTHTYHATIYNACTHCHNTHTYHDKHTHEHTHACHSTSTHHTYYATYNTSSVIHIIVSMCIKQYIHLCIVKCKHTCIKTHSNRARHSHATYMPCCTCYTVLINSVIRSVTNINTIHCTTSQYKYKHITLHKQTPTLNIHTHHLCYGIQDTL